MRRYAVLVFINMDEVRLCFVNAVSIGEADDITKQAYSDLHSRNSIRTEVYDTSLYTRVFEETSITYFY